MARPKSSLKTRRISILVTGRVYEILERLTDDGLAGKTPTETAEELIRRSIEALSVGDSLMAASLKRPATNSGKSES